MEEKNITMCDLIIKIIQGNQLYVREEDRIWEIMGKRRMERIKNKTCGCLAEFAKKELEIAVADNAKQERDRMERLYRRFLRETRVGSMDVYDVSDDELGKIIRAAAESGELKGEDRLRFLKMIQMMARAAAAQVLRLESNALKNVFDDYMKAEAGISYVKNPYTQEEMQKITGWLDQNTDDVRALAADMWLSGGITAKEIVRLRTGWLMDIDGPCTRNPSVIKKNEAEDYLPFTGRRGRIIQDALKIHEGTGNEYIFMIKDGREWKNMSEKCVQLKMSVICRCLDIRYRPFKWTDAILC